MIYVTHDQVEAMTMADRIVVLLGRPASRRLVRRSAKRRLYATLERQQGRRDELVQSLGSLTGSET